MKDIILLTHAFLGCDTTSRIYGIGKDKIIRSTKLQEVCRDAADIFYSANATKEQVQEEGEMLLLNLLNRPTMASLNEARGKIFMEKVDGKQVVKPESLPPNVDEGTLHFYRVYHTIQAWLGNSLLPTEWGWKVNDGKLVPVFSTLPAAPEYLLKYIRCGCNSDGCKSKACSCKKHGKLVFKCCIHFCTGKSCSLIFNYVM